MMSAAKRLASRGRGLRSLAALCLLLGCEGDDACEKRSPEAASGGIEDFKTPPGAYAGYVVGAPTPCGSKSMRIPISGQGWRDLAFLPETGCSGVPADAGMTDCPRVTAASFFSAVLADLKPKGVHASEPWTCVGSDQGLQISDWRSADTAVGAVVDQIVAWQLGSEVSIVVGPPLYECF
jgi:hypothetical protein